MINYDMIHMIPPDLHELWIPFTARLFSLLFYFFSFFLFSFFFFVYLFFFALISFAFVKLKSSIYGEADL